MPNNNNNDNGPSSHKTANSPVNNNFQYNIQNQKIQINPNINNTPMVQIRNPKLQIVTNLPTQQHNNQPLQHQMIINNQIQFPQTCKNQNQPKNIQNNFSSGKNENNKFSLRENKSFTNLETNQNIRYNNIEQVQNYINKQKDSNQKNKNIFPTPHEVKILNKQFATVQSDLPHSIENIFDDEQEIPQQLLTNEQITTENSFFINKQSIQDLSSQLFDNQNASEILKQNLELQEQIKVQAYALKQEQLQNVKLNAQIIQLQKLVFQNYEKDNQFNKLLENFQDKVETYNNCIQQLKEEMEKKNISELNLIQEKQKLQEMLKDLSNKNTKQQLKFIQDIQKTEKSSSYNNLQTQSNEFLQQIIDLEKQLLQTNKDYELLKGNYQSLSQNFNTVSQFYNEYKPIIDGLNIIQEKLKNKVETEYLADDKDFASARSICKFKFENIFQSPCSQLDMSFKHQDKQGLEDFNRNNNNNESKNV